MNQLLGIPPGTAGKSFSPPSGRLIRVARQKEFMGTCLTIGAYDLVISNQLAHRQEWNAM
jgi:hypothetical protein